MASDITITALTAVGMVGQIAATVMASSPASMSCLPYMQPAKVDIYIAATNNFASATLAGTVNSAVGVLMVDGLPELATRYLWAIPKDPDGNAGARYPAGGGVSVTTKATVPDGSVTGPKLADGAVTNAKLANLSVGSANIQNLAVKSQHVESLAADKLTAGTVTVTISFTSPIINGGTINSGTINSGTITGSRFQTKASGARLWIDEANNALLVIDSSGNARVGLGGSGLASGVFVGYNNYETVSTTATLTSANAHALRAKNSGSGGGEAVLGVSAGGGGYAVNAQTGGVYSAGGYLPFTGMHECLVRKDALLAVGDIACVKRVFARNGLDNVMTEVERSGSVADRRVIGIVSKRREMPLFSQIAALGLEPRDRDIATPVRKHLAEHYDLVTVNALGEGQMDVCGRGGDIGAGDYIITSDLPGKGQRLDMDQPVTFGLQAAIVAQTMEPVTFEGPDQVKRVAVFYRCG